MGRIVAWAFAAFIAFPLLAGAGEAPWYKWRSQLNSQLTCAQFSPGEGWVRFTGPYDNPGCR